MDSENYVRCKIYINLAMFFSGLIVVYSMANAGLKWNQVESFFICIGIGAFSLTGWIKGYIDCAYDGPFWDHSD
jgi:hypothetical protein